MSNLAKVVKQEDNFPKNVILEDANYLIHRVGIAKSADRKALDDEATKTSMAEKLVYLKMHLGRQLASHIIGVHPKTMDKYQKINAYPTSELAKILIRESYKITKILVEKFDSDTAKAWLLGTNSLLDEESPADILHNASSAAECKLVIIAALAFIEE